MAAAMEKGMEVVEDLASSADAVALAAAASAPATSPSSSEFLACVAESRVAVRLFCAE
ncbi:unannotated protein [freshwater metagenome]|uniref:Unannotated protein n=1 Tax=freshwater metagenome TaxID=449393 RepID=A0A6J7I340_9ZZZZ